MFAVLWIIWMILLPISCKLEFSSIRRENLTVTHGENVQFHCSLPKNISLKDSIIQWKKWRSYDDYLVLSINGKIPQSLQHLYKTNLTNEKSSLKLFDVNRQDSTIYICEIFETQTILCQYNLIVLSK